MDLIDKEKGCWKRDIKTNNFVHMDQEEITKTHLYHLDKENWLSLHGKKDKYCVRTGYH